MRPTSLQFRYPKEKTSEYLYPKVTNDGISLEFVKPKCEHAEKSTFSRAPRFLQYKVLMKKTGCFVGPGTYEGNKQKISYLNKPCPVRYQKLLTGKGASGGAYALYENNLVYEPSLMNATQRSEQAAFQTNNCQVDLLAGISRPVLLSRKSSRIGGRSFSQSHHQKSPYQLHSVREIEKTTRNQGFYGCSSSIKMISHHGSRPRTAWSHNKIQDPKPQNPKLIENISPSGYKNEIESEASTLKSRIYSDISGATSPTPDSHHSLLAPRMSSSMSNRSKRREERQFASMGRGVRSTSSRAATTLLPPQTHPRPNFHRARGYKLCASSRIDQNIKLGLYTYVPPPLRRKPPPHRKFLSKTFHGAEINTDKLTEEMYRTYQTEYEGKNFGEHDDSSRQTQIINEYSKRIGKLEEKFNELQIRDSELTGNSTLREQSMMIKRKSPILPEQSPHIIV